MWAINVTMNTIIIAGLGPGSWNDVTVAAQEALLNQPSIIFRTNRHPTVDVFRQKRPDFALESFDNLYETIDDWSQLYDVMAQTLVQKSKELGSVVYAVPGHPLFGETSVRNVLKLAASEAIDVTIIAGVSFLESVCSALKIDPLENGLQIIDATELATLKPQQVGGVVFPHRPAIITQVYNRAMLSAAKIALLEVYPAEHETLLAQSAGTTDERIIRLPLSECDRNEYADHLSSLYIPALDPAALQSFRTAESLRYIVERLRGPDGCPWDKKQTHQTLLKYALEEAAEVAEAIDAYDTDPDHLAEELGDLLLQIYLHAEIAQQEESFTINDIFEHIVTKLIRRHPHVFGDVQVSGAEHVVKNWDAIKREERAKKAGGAPEFESTLRNIVAYMPALSNTVEIIHRVNKAGFNLKTPEDWITQTKREYQEFLQTDSDEEKLLEFGDILFNIAGYADSVGMSPEIALRKSNEKFCRRFTLCEQLCHERGWVLHELELPQLAILWQEAKALLAQQDR